MPPLAPPPPAVRLRPVEPGDLAALFRFQSDPESARMAAVIPRSAEAFEAHWARSLADPATTPRVILADGVTVGQIACFPADDRPHVGYWIDRAHWGRGIAGRALALLLEEVPTRPLYARAAATNAASIRVLQRCGFTLTGYEHAPATERYLACEEALFVLA